MNTFDQSLKTWIDDEKAAIEFINVLGKLWFEKSIELICLRSQLIDRGPGKILNKHLRAEAILNKPVRIQDSLIIAKAILANNIAPARIDIGRLNSEWTDDKGKYKDVNEFVLDKLKAFVGVVPRSTKTQDVVLYGFGRIGRLLARELIQIAGNGSQLRLRAIVTRGNTPEEIKKTYFTFQK